MDQHCVMAWTVRRVGASEWRLIRALRLEALADSPRAFGSTFGREEAFSDAEWIAFCAPFSWFAAEEDGRAVGLVAGCMGGRAAPGACEVISMWVEAAARGGGAAVGLIRAVRTWAEAQGASMMLLWVSDGNERARHFYERLGFGPTGLREPLHSYPSISTNEYCLVL